MNSRHNDIAMTEPIMNDQMNTIHMHSYHGFILWWKRYIVKPYFPNDTWWQTYGNDLGYVFSFMTNSIFRYVYIYVFVYVR
jgi:hypothetical protein